MVVGVLNSIISHLELRWRKLWAIQRFMSLRQSKTAAWLLEIIRSQREVYLYVVSIAVKWNIVPLDNLWLKVIGNLEGSFSVVWKALKPDRNFSNKLFCAIKDKRWEETTFCQTFDKNGNLEIGLKLLRSEGSRLGFFKRGWTAACLKADGKTQWIKELLKIDKRLCLKPH